MNPDVGFANVLDRCLAVREEEQVLLLTDPYAIEDWRASIER